MFWIMKENLYYVQNEGNGSSFGLKINESCEHSVNLVFRFSETMPDYWH